MSYSFTIKADTKDEATIKVEEELRKVIVAQSSHEYDRQAAQNAAEAFISILRDPKEGEGVGVSMSGSLSWQEASAFTSATVNVSAYITPKV